MRREMKDWEIQSVLAEYNMLREEMRMFTQFHRRDTHLLIIILGALLAACFAKESKVGMETFYVVAPSVLFIYYLFQIINLHVTSNQSKQCCRIERQLNELSGITLMDWEHVVGRYSRKRIQAPTTLSIVALLFASIVLFIFLSVKAFAAYGTWTAILHGMEFTVLAFTTLMWIYEEWRDPMLRVLESRIRKPETNVKATAQPTYPADKE